MTRELPAVGDRVRCLVMPNDPDPIPAGAEGTVTSVTELPTPMASSYSEWRDGTPVRTQLPAPDIEAEIEVAWDSGRTLNLLHPGDQFEIITHPQHLRSQRGAVAC